MGQRRSLCLSMLSHLFMGDLLPTPLLFLRRVNLLFMDLDRENGFSLVELLVSVLMFSIVSLLIASSSVYTLRSLTEYYMVQGADEDAQWLSHLIYKELREIGSGMPLEQSDFTYEKAYLGDAPLPVLTTSTNAKIVFRRSYRQGAGTVLVSDFDPKSSLSFAVVSGKGLQDGWNLYLSNSTEGGEDGLYGTIESVNGSMVTLSSVLAVTEGAKFPSGSLVSPVETVTIASQPVWGDVTLNGEVIGKNSQVVFEYFDSDGNLIPLPLTPEKIANSLSSIEVSVYCRSERELRTGGYYIGVSRLRAFLISPVWSRRNG
ncbi:MAG: prepilin-type N-terminal cleavage/methylation domain-containing protein [Candidatus Dadabacteria bacterium]|nr:MAG: prepilin-type N-terminal cleavage/methylation domain-containing protein [Candidatus Dadabacteria bacterium]